MWKSLANIPLSQISAADGEKMKELRKEIGIDGRRYRAFCLSIVGSFARFINFEIVYLLSCPFQQFLINPYYISNKYFNYVSL